MTISSRSLSGKPLDEARMMSKDPWWKASIAALEYELGNALQMAQALEHAHRVGSGTQRLSRQYVNRLHGLVEVVHAFQASAPSQPPMTPPREPLLTPKEASTYLKISSRTLRRYVEAGRLPVITLPGSQKARQRFHRRDVEAWLEARTSGGTEESE
jgi:excisionase family DNA binding protein